MRVGDGTFLVERSTQSRRTDPYFVGGDRGEFIPRLLDASLILAADWETLPLSERELLRSEADPEKVLASLVERGLITQFIARRVCSGKTFGLVLGNFRILERLGAGGMAVVYKAEHIEMRHLVAIKVLEMSPESDPHLMTRFTAEQRAIARLRHPNIVAAMDAGKAQSANPADPVLWYLVMEYVPGEDLDCHVRSRKGLSVAAACDLVYQIASALAETHKLGLVHRDIKPSNILVTPEGHAKLLDFGLSRHQATRLTNPGTVMGTIDFMAPEQARDSSSVDLRADIYSLGGTLFWCLTGHLPFPDAGGGLQSLLRRLTQQSPSPRDLRPGLPAELDAVARKMMALDPKDRYTSADEVMTALLPFIQPDSLPGGARAVRKVESSGGLDASGRPRPNRHAQEVGWKAQRVLIVDEQPSMRLFCKAVLQGERVHCEEAGSGQEALVMAAERLPDLVLLDLNLKGMPGPDVLRALRNNHPGANLKVLLLSDQGSDDDLARMLLTGADDYLTRPFRVTQLVGRVQAALRLKEAQDQADALNRQLGAENDELGKALSASVSDVKQVRTGLMCTLAQLLALREDGGCGRMARMQQYCRVLAEEASRVPSFSGLIDSEFIDLLVLCAPLHDSGNLGMPDHILLKPGKLDVEERAIIQAHTTLPCKVLAEMGQAFGAVEGLLRMARDIIRHHHERHDGTGYPDGLAGSAIPLAARIVAVADVYDALRSRRPYRPALTHFVAVKLICESPGQFDPDLVQAFQKCAGQFERIFKEQSLKSST